MITIRQSGRMFKIESNIDVKLENVISKHLSYMKKNAHFMTNPMFGLVRLYNKKTKVFPAGLIGKVRHILEEWKRQKGEDYEIISNKPQIIQYDRTHNDDLRPYQKDAVESVVNNWGGIVSSPTGSGKIFIGAEIIRIQNPQDKKLILVPTRELVKQWREKTKDIKNLDIDTYAMLYRHLDRLNQYKWVVMDECHRVSAKTLYKVGMHCNDAIMIGLSATPGKRDDGEDLKMFAVLGDIVYHISTEELVRQGYLLPTTAYILPVEKVEVSPFEEYRDIYNNHIINNDKRNQQIVDLAIEQCENGTCMIMIENLEHGNILLKMLSTQTKDKKIIFVHGTTKDREQVFNDAINNKFDIIIATRVYNEGVSIACIKSLILAGGGKGTIKITQQVGRLLRQYPGKERAIIYDFQDNCKILKRHVAKRIKIYNENGFEVIYL